MAEESYSMGDDRYSKELSEDQLLFRTIDNLRTAQSNEEKYILVCHLRDLIIAYADKEEKAELNRLNDDLKIIIKNQGSNVNLDNPVMRLRIFDEITEIKQKCLLIAIKKGILGENTSSARR